MDAVDNQGVEGRDRAARLAWRAEVITAAVQKLGSEIFKQESWRHDPPEWHAWLSHAFDLSLIAASGLFDPIFYLSANRDVAQARIDPLEHYLRYGGQEGRWPGPAFDGTVYLASHETLRRSGLNPLIHYLKSGLLEEHRDGVPEIHPPPVGAAADRGGSEPMPGLFALPANPSGQSGYAAVLDLQAQHAALEATIAGLRAAAEQGDDALRAVQSERDAALSAKQALEVELEALREAVEWRDHQLLALQSDFTTAITAARVQEAAQQNGREAEVAVLRAARDEAELKLYAANASLQRAAARNDRLGAALRASERETAGLRAELAQRDAAGHAIEGELADALAAAQAREAEREAEAASLRAARDAAELKLYAANASLQRAAARNDRLAAAIRVGTAVQALPQEARGSDDAWRALEDETAAARAAASAAHAELADTRSELTATGRELALAARELMLTGRELHRLQGEESGHREARTERDALRLRMALLERDVQRGREQEAALIVSRAEAATLAERARANEIALAALRAEAPSLAALADAVRAGLAARGAAGHLADARERTGHLEILGAATADPDERVPALRRLYLDLLEAALAALLPVDEGKGRDDPAAADRPRLGHLRRLLETVLEEHVEGDVVEAGVRQGEAAIYMRGILAAYAVVDRTVWVADAFGARLPARAGARSAGGRVSRIQEPAIPVETVRDRFARLCLLDGQVAFLPGHFEKTLSNASIRRIAVLRLGGGPPGSAVAVLEALYPRVAPGGFVVIDASIDDACRAAIDAYRLRQNVEGTIDEGSASVFWRKVR